MDKTGEWVRIKCPQAVREKRIDEQYDLGPKDPLPWAAIRQHWPARDDSFLGRWVEWFMNMKKHKEP